MPTTSSMYNNPAIGQAASNIAQMFAPPSGMDMAGYANAAATRASAARAAALAAMGADPNTPMSAIDKQAFANGNETGTQTLYANGQNNATTARGQDLSYQLGIQQSLMKQLDPNSQFYVPPQVAAAQGTPSVIKGANLPSMDQVKAAAFGQDLNNGTIGPADRKEMDMTGVAPVMTRSSTGAVGFQNPQAAVSSGAAPAVVPGSAAQAFQTAQGSNEATNYNAILTGGQQATQRLSALEQLDQASKSAGYQGIGGSNVMVLRKALAALGFDTSRESDAEVLQSGGNQFALQLRNPANGGGMPGNLTDADRNYLSSMTAGVDHTPAGNAKLIAAAKAVAQRDIDTANLANRYVAQHGQLDGGFTQTLASFARTHPIMPGLPATPNADEVASLPSGTIYINPDDGKPYRRP